jgi:hypothetical protein
MLFYIVFVVAEIRNVLIESNPGQAEPITIWNETLQPLSGESDISTISQGSLAFSPCSGKQNCSFSLFSI